MIESHVTFDAKKLVKENPECVLALEKRFTYSNPEYYKLQSMGYKYTNTPKRLRSYKKHKNGKMSFSRGTLKTIKKILRDHGHKVRIHDNRLELPAISFDDNIVLRDEQLEPVQRMVKKQQGLVRGPCSSGKTVMLLKAISIIKQPTTVVVWNTNHQKQWKKEVEQHLNLDSDEIGGCGGIFKKPIAGKVNLCMQQSLYKKETLDFFAERTGCVAGDEVQRYGAKTYEKTINGFPAKYRLGVSANERRKDGKHFLIYDGFGEVIHEIEDRNIGSRLEAKCFLIPTKFKSEDYEAEGNWSRLITEITEDKKRNNLILKVVKRSLRREKLCLIFTERKAHALWLRDSLSEFRTGLMIGNTTTKEIRESDWPEKWKIFMKDFDSGVEYDRVKKLGDQRKLDVIIATQKGDVGINILPIDHGFITTPTGNNKERFNQQKGRIERDHNEALELQFGKKSTPHMYYFWDTGIEKLQKAGNTVMKSYPGTGILKLKKKRKRNG